MMSDLEYIKRMLEDSNIPFKENKDLRVIFITVERGYAGFVTEMSFNLGGKFLDIGAFE